jgi:hypothetical protein
MVPQSGALKKLEENVSVCRAQTALYTTLSFLAIYLKHIS